MIDIDKAFEGRWRIKGFDQHEVRPLSGEDVKRYCLDFFEAGVAIASTTEKGDDIQLSTQDFEYWWSLYDKKCGKADCMKKWAKMSSRDKAACIAATPAYVASTAEKRFRKNPLTYLNQKAWNDEIIARKDGNDKQQERAERLSAIARRIGSYDAENAE